MSYTMHSIHPKRYFGLHYLLLRILGLGWWHHPDKKNTRNFHGWYFYYALITELLWVGIFVGLESIDPFIGNKNLDQFMFNLSFVVTHDLTLIKLYIFFFKNQEIQSIVRTLEIDLQAFYQNNEKNLRTIRVTKILTASFLFFGWITIGNTSIYGIVQDIRWKKDVSHLNYSIIKPERILPLPIYIPWNFQTDKMFIITYLFETLGLLWTGHIVMTIDTFIGSVILHMSSQFSILQEAFLTAYDRAITKLYEEIETNEVSNGIVQEKPVNRNKYIDKESIIKKYRSDKEIEDTLNVVLKNCFKQHQVLISCVEKFSATYSYGFVTQLLSSMAAICSVMVQVSFLDHYEKILNRRCCLPFDPSFHLKVDASGFKSMRLITSLAFFVAMVIQLAIQCFTGNELTYEAGKVADVVMQSKWERMPPRLRKLLVITIMRAQKPLHLSAAGFANMNNGCFLSILKAAYSYYAVLSKRRV